MTIVLAAIGIAWAVASVAAGILIGRAIKLAQSPDRPPLDRRELLYVADILSVKQVQR